MAHQLGQRGKYLPYKKASLQLAVALVQSGAMSLRKAAISYGVPKSTLSYKLHGRTAMEFRQGPRTVLFAEEEEKIASWAINMSRIGYGRTRQELLSTVQKILKEDGCPNPFKNDKSGKDWLNGFLKRHPNLAAERLVSLVRSVRVSLHQMVSSLRRLFWYGHERIE